MSSEVVFIHVGQAGTQIGKSCWELFCLEHGIQPDGFQTESEKGKNCENEKSSHPFFSRLSSGKFVPRAVFVDLDPTTIECVKNGKYGQLFCPDDLLKGKQSGSDCYASAHYYLGKEIVDLTLDRLRKQTENCSNFSGFIVTHAVGGGTGSGFASLLLERLSVDYGKKSKIGFTIYPSPNITSSCVEPYNAVLSTHSLLEHIDLSILYDNEQLYSFMGEKYKIHNPTFEHINRLVARNIDCITSSFRYKDSSLYQDVQTFQTNLVPYPRIHFCTNGYACSSFPTFDTEIKSASSLFDKITNDVLYDPSYTLVSTHPQEWELKGRYTNHNRSRIYSCCMMYRGNDVFPSLITSSIRKVRDNNEKVAKYLSDFEKKRENRKIRKRTNRKRGKKNLPLKPEIEESTPEEVSKYAELKSRIKFVDWCPTAFKVGVTKKKNPVDLISRSSSRAAENDNDFRNDVSLGVVMNSSLVADIFSRIDRKFDMMYAKRAFVHWYMSPSMEEGEFSEAREDLAALEKDHETWECCEWVGESEDDFDDEIFEL